MADRIGVINKGELILVEDKTTLMRKLGKKQLTLQLQAPLERIPDGLSTYPLELNADGHHAGVHLRRAGAGDRHRRAAPPPPRPRHRLQGPAFQREFAGGHLRQPGAPVARGGARMNVHAIRAIYRFEMARTFRTLMETHRLAGAVDLAVLRRLRRRHRRAHGRGRRRQLRRLHHSRPDHAVAAEREHLERVLRHLHAQVGRHDLRAAVGAGVGDGNRDRLRRRGGDQVADAGYADPRDRALLRAVPDRAPGLDALLPGADRAHLQPVRLHHRPVGRQLPAACSWCR